MEIKLYTLTDIANEYNLPRERLRKRADSKKLGKVKGHVRLFTEKELSSLLNDNLFKKKTITNEKKEKFSSSIWEGDTIKMLSKLDKDLKFDIIIADPPYNIGKNFGNNFDQLEINEYIKWSKKWINLSMNFLKEEGLCYIYGFPEILARIASQYPLENQRILAWHYTNKTTPSLNFWQRSYESILCLWKGNKRPNLEIDQIREPYTSNYLKHIGKVRIGTKGRFGSNPTLYKVNEKGALPRDVIKIPALAGGAGNSQRFFLCKNCQNSLYPSSELKNHENHEIIQHPTQKPIQLTEVLLRSVIKENNKTAKVLIPFAGSGSECVTAKMLGISYLGIEINPEYVYYAQRWLSQVCTD